MTNEYNIDTQVKLTANFTIEANGSPVDPTSIHLFLRSPAGVVQEFSYGSSAMARLGVGQYQYIFTFDQQGRWKYKWQGTGFAEISSDDISVDINKTVFSLSP